MPTSKKPHLPEQWHKTAGSRPVPEYKHSYLHQRAIDEVAILDPVVDYAPRPLDMFKRQGTRNTF